MNKFNSIITPLALAAVLALAACSTPPIKSADKNFERAWLAYVTLRTDQAMDYFADAAGYYTQALDEQSRVAHYPSSRVKAGMAFYFAGEYDRCIESMAASHRTGEHIWEADLFTALAFARQGDRDKAVDNMNRFLEDMPTARLLLGVVRTQVTAMQSGVDIGESADLTEEAFQKQMVETIKLTTSPTTVRPEAERCDGAFWWRRNKKPCSAPSGGNK